MPIRTILVAAIALLSFAATAQAQFWSPSFTELTATNGASGDGFGYSVAIDGSTCVIGAPFANSSVDGDAASEEGGTTGSAYVFEVDSDNTWTQVAELRDPEGQHLDRFGHSVALEGDTCVIGAPYAAKAFVFSKKGGGWSLDQIIAKNPDGARQFGHSVDLDGETCVIGAPATDSDTGSAYVFTRSEGTGGDQWSEDAKLTFSSGQGGDLFGSSVALDGRTCIIGAPGNNSNTGSAHIFNLRNATDAWSEGQVLEGPNGAPNDNFGYSVALDGGFCVIGAPKTSPNGSATGNAYILTEAEIGNGDVMWLPSGLLSDPFLEAGENFGYSVALDGTTCMVGNIKSGKVFVFNLLESGWLLTEFIDTGTSSDSFGHSVAFQADGGIEPVCVIGAIGANSGTGRAYVYEPGGIGACCLDGRCILATTSHCIAAGGSYAGHTIACEDANCDKPLSGDVDGDGDVDTDDLSSLRSTLALCASDVDSDGDTDIEDLLSVISGYGGTTCP